MTSQPDRSLLELLGFTPGDSVFVETTPGWYTDFADGNKLELEPSLPATHAHIFVRSRAEFTVFLRENDLRQVKESLWVSWPKSDSKERTDLDTRSIRTSLQPLGWIEAKTASIDDTWTGLKFQRQLA